MSKKLDSVLQGFKKAYKVDVVPARQAGVVERLTLDSPGLNYAFSGGMPLGRMMFFQGPESGGKTTLASYLAMQVQKKYEGHNTVVYFDYEYTLDAGHLEEMGVDVDNNFILLRPTCGEDGWNMMKELVETGEVGLVVIDSVTAMASKAACEDAFNGFVGGRTAAMIADGIRMLLPYLYNNKCSMIMISQERTNIGVMYGPDFKATGGRAPAFYSTWSARITRDSQGDILDENKELAGIKMKIRNTKNKVGIAKRDATLKLYFKGGIDSDDEYVDYLKSLGIITQKGPYYSNEEWGMKVLGIDKVREFLQERPELYAQVKRDVNALITGHTILDEQEQEVSEEERASGAWDNITEEDVNSDFQ